MTLAYRQGRRQITEGGLRIQETLGLDLAKNKCSPAPDKVRGDTPRRAAVSPLSAPQCVQSQCTQQRQGHILAHAGADTHRLMSSLRRGIRGDSKADTCLYLGGRNEI